MSNLASLAELLKQTLEKNRRENPDLDWRKVAHQIGIPENSLYRWLNSGSVPANLETFDKLAKFAGPDVYLFWGSGIDKGLAWLLAHRDDPNVAAVIDDARRVAQAMLEKGQ